MPVAPIAAAVGAAAAVVGTAASMKAQKKQAKMMAQAQKFERQKTELQSARQRTQALREARQSYANSQQAAANQGVETSSVAVGGQASITSQFNSNLSFLDKFGYFSDQASKALGKANDAATNGSMWGAVAGLGAQAYAASGGFTGPKPPTAPKG